MSVLRDLHTQAYIYAQMNLCTQMHIVFTDMSLHLQMSLGFL